MNLLARDIQTACLWEVSARKAGNVHPLVDFHDLTYRDFVRSAAAIAPVLAGHVAMPLGATILAAVRATREVVSTNTNLGIVLLLAPLSKAAPGCWHSQIPEILHASTVADATAVYQAIRLAVPGGMGTAEQQDIADEPTQTLREVMSLAADRDLIARQYTNGFRYVIDQGVPALLQGWEQFASVEAAILHLQLQLLDYFPDSLIARKRSQSEAEEVSRRARKIDLTTAEGRQNYAAFDAWLREEGHARNPGTTADLITACLFVALREHKMDLAMPFSWDLYG